MRRIIILGFCLIGIFTDMISQISSTYGDLIFEDTLDFSPQHSWIVIDNPTTNIWEIGKPDKVFFNAALTGSSSLLTDYVDFYTCNRNDYFYITIPWSFSENFWGEGILSFYHKFDTDTLIDGGVIEVSYDHGMSWINVLNDSNHISVNFIGLYGDTIKGGLYGFSGKSDNWQYVELYWHWIGVTKSTTMDLDTSLIRFRFVSDDINTNKEGWMIDDIVFRGYAIGNSIDEDSQMQIEVFPNPTRGLINIEVNNESFRNLIIAIFDLSGKKLNIKKIVDGQADLFDIPTGIYMYKIFGDSEIISSGKLLKY